MHAESFVIADETILSAVRAGEVAELTLYLSYQPCHHSGGRFGGGEARQRRRAHRQHPTSCTEAPIATTREVPSSEPPPSRLGDFSRR